MSGKLSISGDGEDWHVFGRTPRDLFFTARDLDDLREGITRTDIDPFKFQLAPVVDKEAFLNGLSLSQEQVQAAAAGRMHQVPVQRSGSFLGKLFGR